MHTNLDNALNGVNFKIAEKMGLIDTQLFAEKTVGDIQGGSGVIGELKTPMKAIDFIQLLKDTFDVKCVKANELLERDIRRVAICGGAGAFLLGKAVKEGADAFITGEMHYHEFFGLEQQIQICVIGHYQSEQYTNEILKSIIEEKCKGVRCCLTDISTNPIIYL